MVLRLPDSWSNWNLEMLVFEERGKPEYPEKNLSEQRREPTTNSTDIWRRRRELNPGHLGGRRVLSPLRHPCSAKISSFRAKAHMLFYWCLHNKKKSVTMLKTSRTLITKGLFTWRWGSQVGEVTRFGGVNRLSI